MLAKSGSYQLAPRLPDGGCVLVVLWWNLIFFRVESEGVFGLVSSHPSLHVVWSSSCCGWKQKRNAEVPATFWNAFSSCRCKTLAEAWSALHVPIDKIQTVGSTLQPQNWSLGDAPSSLAAHPLLPWLGCCLVLSPPGAGRCLKHLAGSNRQLLPLLVGCVEVTTSHLNTWDLLAPGAGKLRCILFCSRQVSVRNCKEFPCLYCLKSFYC